MELFKTFKQRKLEKTTTPPDIYEYNDFPSYIRIQVWHIIVGVLGGFNHSSTADGIYTYIHKFFLREFGTFSLKSFIGLQQGYKDTPEEDISTFLLNAKDPDQFLSIVELFFSIIDNYRDWPYDWFGSHQKPDDAIEELNLRFQRANLGYEFVDGLIIPIDSKEIHKEVVKPALSILASEPIYKGSDDEYRQAFQFFKDGNYEQVLSECNKAIESCLVAICEKRGWRKSGKTTTGSLLATCKEKNLFPSYTSDFLDKLIGVLKGVSTIRGQDSSHGQGTEVRDVSKEIASYSLHMTATNIVFLIERERTIG